MKDKLKDFFPTRNVNGIIENFSWVVGVITFRADKGKNIDLDLLIKDIVNNRLILKNDLESLACLIYKNMGISPFWTLFALEQKKLPSPTHQILNEFNDLLFQDFKGVPYWKIFIEYEWLKKIYLDYKSALLAKENDDFSMIFKDIDIVSKNEKNSSENLSKNEKNSSENLPKVFQQYLELKAHLKKAKRLVGLKELKRIFVEKNNMGFEKQNFPSLICNQSPISGLIVLILLQRINEARKSSEMTKNDEQINKSIERIIECLDGVFTVIEKWKFSSEEFIRFFDFRKNLLIEVIIFSLFPQKAIRDPEQFQTIVKEAKYMPSLFEMKEIQDIGFSKIIKTKNKLIETLLLSESYSKYLATFQTENKPINNETRKFLFSVFRNNVPENLLLLLDVTKMEITIPKKEEKKVNKAFDFEKNSQENQKISHEKSLLQIINKRDPTLINNITFVESLLYFYQKGSLIEITKDNVTANRALNINMKSNRDNIRTFFELLTKKNLGIVKFFY